MKMPVRADTAAEQDRKRSSTNAFRGPRTDSLRMRLGPALMGLLILAVVGVALGANVWKLDLPVRTVRAEGNRIVPAAEILRLAAIPPGTKLFDVELAAIRRRVQQHPFVREVSVNREGPEGIAIRVVERTPVAALAGDQLLYIDEEGTVLPSARSAELFDLPVLTGAAVGSDCVPGHRITRASVAEALEVFVLSRRLSEDAYRRISELTVTPEGALVLHTAEFGVPVLVGRGELASKLLKLDAFWRDVVDRQGVRELQYVDLRFDDQVVARWNSRPAQ